MNLPRPPVPWALAALDTPDALGTGHAPEAGVVRGRRLRGRGRRRRGRARVRSQLRRRLAQATGPAALLRILPGAQRRLGLDHLQLHVVVQRHLRVRASLRAQGWMRRSACLLAHALPMAWPQTLVMLRSHAYRTGPGSALITALRKVMSWCGTTFTPLDKQSATTRCRETAHSM